MGPALAGGFVVSCVREQEVVLVKRPWPAEIKIIVVSPQTQLETKRARAALPSLVDRADAVYNLQRSALFVAALAEGRYDLLWEGMQDRLHQDERRSLVPGVTKGCVAVRDVSCVFSPTHAVREGAAARDDQVVFTNRQLRNRPWKQGQQAPETVLPCRRPLQVRGANAPMGEAIVRSGAVVEQRINRSVGKAVSDRGERALGATHDEKVIVHQRYGQGAKTPVTAAE